MKNKITVLNEETFSSGYSQKKLESVEIFIQDVLNHLGFENWEMNVLFCDDKFMQEMNLQYRNIDSPTDVLSFEQGDYYIDDDENPTICDNGTEDYFGGAWNFGAYDVVPNSNEIEFNTPFLGLPKVDHQGKINNKFSMYRFHILDCIGFKKNMRVTVDTIGWELDHSKYRHTTEKVASVAYYYQYKK
jgi:hypothetical protein